MTPTDPRAEQPEGKETVKFEPPPKWAEAMFTRVHEGIAAVEARITNRIDEQGTKLDQCVVAIGTVTNEMERVKRDFYEHKGEVVARFDTHSMRARQESVHDDNQDVKLQELENRLTKAAESSMRVVIAEAKAAVAVVAKTSMGQKLLTAGGYMLLALFGLGTVYFGILATRLQQQPQQPTTVVQQNAPAPPPVDAGAR